MVKDVAKKFVLGFGFGLGMISAGLAFALYQQELRNLLIEPATLFIGAEISSLEITAQKQRQDSLAYTVVGKVKNNGNVPFRYIVVKAEVYDGEFVLAKCTSSVENGGTLHRQEIGNFILTCAGLTGKNDFNYPYRISLLSAQKPT